MKNNKKKDILFLCQFFYPEYISSATLPYDAAQALAKAGLSVDVICGYPKEYNTTSNVPIHEIHEGITIKRIKYLQLKRNNFFGRVINYFSFTFLVFLRFNQLKNYKSIIVYSNPPILPMVAALANKLFNTKVVFVSFDVYPEVAYATNAIVKGSLLSKIMEFSNSIIFKHITKVIALSSEMKLYLLQNRECLNKEQIKVIPNWYENKKLTSKMISLKNRVFSSIKINKRFIVSHFGNLGICQDLDTIMEAIRHFKNNNKFQFVFAGHGNKMGYLKKVIEEENFNNVLILGFLHGQDFDDALNISDCLIVSLSKGLSGLSVPSKTYSYMMAGKPIIAIMEKDSDIAKDLKKNNAGYSIEVGESSNLINILQELSIKKDKCKIMGENCKKLFHKKYTKQFNTQKYVELMQSVVEDNQYV
jgi:glycosyltransferase involved in cell wall biosynthesis